MPVWVQLGLFLLDLCGYPQDQLYCDYTSHGIVESILVDGFVLDGLFESGYHIVYSSHPSPAGNHKHVDPCIEHRSHRVPSAVHYVEIRGKALVNHSLHFIVVTDDKTIEIEVLTEIGADS